MTTHKNMTCTICKSECKKLVGSAQDHEYHSSDRIFEYLQCPNHCSIKLGATLTPNELKAAYPPTYYSFSMLDNYNKYKNSFWGKRFYNSMEQACFQDLRKIAKILNKDISQLKILDYGSGDGFRLKLYNSTGAHEKNLFGYEPFISGNMRPNIHSSIVSIFQLNVKFDLIIASHVIEHLEHPSELFKNISKMISPNGVAIIEMPTPEGWHFQATKSGHWGGYHAPRHFNLLTINGLKLLANENGFETLKIEELDDTWIMAQTLHSYMSLLPKQYVPKWLRDILSAGSKEIPTFSRTLVFGLLSLLGRAIIALGGGSTNLRILLRQSPHPQPANRESRTNEI